MENYEVIFESENIYYVKPTNRLMNEYLKMYNNEEVQKQLFKKTYNNEQILAWLKKQLLSKENHIFSMIEKTTTDYIGNIEIVCKENGIGEIIIAIIPSKQNKHFGTEAIKSVIKYGYEYIGLKNFDLYVYKDNLAAIHCYKNAGFKIAGEGLTSSDIHMSNRKMI